MTDTTLHGFAKTVAMTTLLLSSSITYANLIDATYGIGAGSFELGNYVDGGGILPSAPGYMGVASGDSSTIIGWTVGGPGDGVDWLIEPVFNADTGIHSIDLQHLSSSSIYTEILTDPGNLYRLTFSVASSTAPLPTSNTGFVSAGSLINQAFSATFSPNHSSQTYTVFDFQFEAVAPVTRIEFTGAGPTGQPGTWSYGPVIDSVSVQSVPIPSSIILVGSGLLFLFSPRRAECDSGSTTLT